MIRSILFDFDGVVLDSNRVKREAFSHVFSPYDREQVEELLRYHDANLGLSRYAKFRYFFEVIRREPADHAILVVLAARFTSFVTAELSRPDYLIDETVRFLERTSRTHHLHVVSGSDEVELKGLCNVLGLTRFFLSIHGSPTEKDENVRALLQARGYDPAQTLLIGDGTTDYEVARAAGIHFAGYNNPSLRGLDGARYIDSFEGLSIERLMGTPGDGMGM